MAVLTQNQLEPIFKKAAGRSPTEYEVQKYGTAPSQTLANLKDTFSKLNPNSLSDYLTSIGQDNSLDARSKLAGQFGISNAFDNESILHALKNNQSAQPTQVSGSIQGATPTVQPVQTPQQSAQEKANMTGQPANDGNNVVNPQVNGSISGAAQTTGQPGTIESDPTVQGAKATYTDYQSKVMDIDKQLNSIKKSKMEEIARSGGVVNEASLTSEILRENEPLLALRKEYAAQQSAAGKDYQNAQANFYKNQQLSQGEEKIGLANQKQATQEAQFAEKQAQQAQQFEQKLASSNIVKKAVYQDGTKVGEVFVDKTGKKINVNPTTGDKIGSGYSVGVSGNLVSSNPVNTAKGKVTYTDFAKVPDAPTNENRNTAYPGTNGKTYGAIWDDAVTYAQTGKYQKAGMGSKPSITAYDTAVKSKASNIAASLGMTEQDLRTAYKANSSAIGKLISQKSTTAAYENKAKAQIDMILNGYKDPVSGKQVPPLNDSVPRNNLNAVNSLFVAGKIQTGDIPAKLLSNALITFSTEYAKIMAGSTGSSAGSSDSARQEAQSLISTALTNGQLAETLGLLQKEMDTTVEGYDKQIKDNSSSISLSPKSEQPTTNAPIAKGQMTSSQYVNTILTNLGMKYDAFIKAVPKGKIPVIDNATGQTGYLDNESEITSDYTRI